MTLGDIGITEHWVVTPHGTAPLGRVHFSALDRTYVQEKIPTHAIVLAVVFAVFCLLGLLFLLMKEQVVTGSIEVTVWSDELHHQTYLPVRNAAERHHWTAAVQHAQGLADRAR